MKLHLSPFSLAFVLSDVSVNGLGPAEEEKLRLTTGGYLQYKLKSLYPSFQGLNFTFVSFQNQVRDPGAKFHICLEAKVAVFFENGTEEPEKDDVLNTLLAQFDTGYVSVIRKAFDDTSSLTRAMEVHAQRLEDGITTNEAITPTGAVPVRIPNTYVAFAMPDCHVEPSQKDYKKLVKTTTDFFTSEFRKKFESFRGIEVSVRRSMFGKSEPDENYNVYVEWELVASFAPSEAGTVPGQAWLGMALIGADLDKYYKSHVVALKGTPFAGALHIFIGQVADN